MKLDVEITAEDCADGARRTERYCVVSTAIARLLPDANRIETNVNTIRFTLAREGMKTRSRFAYRTPPVVQEYIRAFDAGAEFKPMKFTLENPRIAERDPAPKGKAKTASFKPQNTAKTHRSVRVFGEKALQPVKTA